jgi:hypothetical protein
MESVQFDRLTKSLSARLPRRTTLGLLSALAAGLGLGGVPLPGGVAGKGGKGGKGKKKGKKKNSCRRGQLHGEAGCDDKDSCPAGTVWLHRCRACVPELKPCCPGEQYCPSGFEPSCSEKNECCTNQRKCTKKVGQQTVITCIDKATCCPGEVKCVIVLDGCCKVGEACAEFDGCCDPEQGKSVCDGKWCCTQDQKCCPGQGCIPKTAGCDTGSSCPADPRGCCDPGEQCCPGLGCRPTTDACCVLSCPGTPTGCCQQGEICTTGTYNGVPRASCCNPAELAGLLGPCDGVCCATNPAVSTCCPGCSNPCRATVAGCAC